MEPIENGDVLLNPTWLNMKLQADMQAAGGMTGMEGGALPEGADNTPMPGVDDQMNQNVTENGDIDYSGYMSEESGDEYAKSLTKLILTVSD